MESELTPDVILYFRQIQQQVANDLATIITLENSATDAAASASNSRDEAKQYATDLETALAVAKGYRDESGVSAAAAAESAIHAFESESVVIANANAAALSEANALQYKNDAQSAAATAADDASTLAAEQTAAKIKQAVKTDADRAEAAREGAETAQSTVDTQAGEVDRLHTEVGQLVSAAAGSSNRAAQSASESDSSKNAAAQSEQTAVVAAEAAGNSAIAAAGDKAATEGFRDEAEEFAARAKASAESIDVSDLEQQIQGKASTQQLADGLANKLTIQSTFLSTDLNLAVTSGVYHPTAAALNLPLQVLGVMEVYLRQGGTSLVQVFHSTVMTVGNTNRHFVRVGTLSDSVWSFGAWAEQYTSLTPPKNQGGFPLLFSWWHDSRTHLPEGSAPRDGQELSRALFPDAWAEAQARGIVISESDWQADPLKRMSWSSGNGTTTFRLPDENGKSPGSVGAPVRRGDGAKSNGVIGTIQLDAFQGHFHREVIPTGEATGVARIRGINGTGEGGTGFQTVREPITDGTNGTPRTAAETRMLNATGCYVIKLAGSALNEGQINALQLATEITALTTRVTTLEAIKPRLITILYPGGSASAPPTLTINQRLSYATPFAGRKIDCRVELLYVGSWGDMGFGSNIGSGSNSFGAIATSINDGPCIQTGLTSLGIYSLMLGNGWGVAEGGAQTLPFRLIVWTID
ncbi:pyocin knob domain-containing protein [Yersinia bercovieri]|uniref:pyocin knob domain-containing protein n=1 Tax=Yersinia bercovieri TaxID=634 RepID=UPI001643BB1A|nr:pyocin knob domain-containing protein [Yersinia bercovieri]